MRVVLKAFEDFLAPAGGAGDLLKTRLTDKSWRSSIGMCKMGDAECEAPCMLCFYPISLSFRLAASQATSILCRHFQKSWHKAQSTCGDD